LLTEHSAQHRFWAVVPAAGVGRRMGSDCPKQYLPLLDKPVLQHTLERLAACAIQGIVVSISADDPYWPSLPKPAKVWTAAGGAERCHSVLNGLRTLLQRPEVDAQDWVLVHDAARPCVRLSDLTHLMQSAATHPVGGLLATPVRDTLKRADAQNQVAATVDRQNLWHALTPQMFRLQALHDALTALIQAGSLVTDEAQAMEQHGYQPLLINGHPDNIKITHPQDLALATLFLQQQQ
jgi:2-C-methyl-D-erythritol 4-phosphate cytidylyltransferase